MERPVSRFCVCCGFAWMIAATVLSTILRLGEHVTSSQYVALLLFFCALVGIAIMCLPRLTLVDFRRMRLEMEGIRDDVYAKAEEVKAAAKCFGELTMFNLAWSGRLLGSGDRQAFNAHNRTQIERMLTKLGVPDPEIAAICEGDSFMELTAHWRRDKESRE